MTIEAARDTYDSSMQRNGGKKAGTSHSVHNVRSEIEAGNHIAVTSLSGDVTAQAVKFAANKPGDGTVALTAQQGQVALTSVTDEESWTYKSSSSNIATYKMRNAGAVDTTVAMTEVDADGGLVVKAGKGVVVEYRDAGSLEASLATLSATPGLEWMETLAKRDDVAWKAVQEAHDHWDYKSQGLSAPAAAIIAIAVSIATAGAGAGTGALLGVENAALAAGIDAAASAGIGTLASQAAVSLVNNQGDIGKVLKELGSSESVRSILVSMASAGLTQGITASADFKELLSAGTTFSDRLANEALRQMVKAGVGTVAQTTLGGQKLQDALVSNLRSAAAGTMGTVLANQIGDYAAFNGIPDGDIQKVVLHALTGCAAGAAGSGDCLAGATGSGLGELLGKPIAEAIPDPNQQTGLLSLIAGVAGALAGGDADAVNVAANAAATTHQNNYLNHEELRAALANREELRRCTQNGGICTHEEISALAAKEMAFAALSQANTSELLQVCLTAPTSPDCSARVADLKDFAARLESERDSGLVFAPTGSASPDYSSGSVGLLADAS